MRPEKYNTANLEYKTPQWKLIKTILKQNVIKFPVWKNYLDYKNWQLA